MTMVTADDLIDGLRGSGYRITEARRQICLLLAGEPEGHLSAADVLDGVSGVDQSTVYRTLEALERVGLVEHIHMGHGAGAYHVAPAGNDHHHLVCEACGTVVDVPLSRVRAAVDDVARSHGFLVDTAHFALVGRCTSCAAPGTTSQ